MLTILLWVIIFCYWYVFMIYYFLNLYSTFSTVHSPIQTRVSWQNDEVFLIRGSDGAPAVMQSWEIVFLIRVIIIFSSFFKRDCKAGQSSIRDQWETPKKSCLLQLLPASGAKRCMERRMVQSFYCIQRSIRRVCLNLLMHSETNKGVGWGWGVHILHVH